MKSFSKLILLFSFIILTGFNFPICKDNPTHDIDKLIKKMTLKQKVGQMTQLNLDVISVGEIFNLKEPHQLDSAKLRKALVEYGVGSILNVGGHAYSLEHWNSIIK